MTTLAVGFDSAWTAGNKGAIVGAAFSEHQSIRSLGCPLVAGFEDAADTVARWQQETGATKTIIAIDQPTIVCNHTGQRPVEKVVSSAVSKRLGGMQPANRLRAGMFDDGAPIWQFLDRFGGAARLDRLNAQCVVVETYPVLEIIARGWIKPHLTRQAGTLPKYNPERKTFCLADWISLCQHVGSALGEAGLSELAKWCCDAQFLERVRKRDQDRLDACICLLVAIQLGRGENCMAVGEDATGYIVVSHGNALSDELSARCNKVGWSPSAFVQSLASGQT